MLEPSGILRRSTSYLRNSLGLVNLCSASLITARLFGIMLMNGTITQ